MRLQTISFTETAVSYLDSEFLNSRLMKVKF